jgi:hypothetical protein
MKDTVYFLISIGLICMFISCKEKVPKERSDFFFRVPESDIGITCSKRIGAEFYVMFSRDSTQLSGNVDYLKYRTGDMSEVNMIFDPENKSDIYIRDTEYLKEINPVNYNLQVLKKAEFDSLFYKRDYNPEIKAQSLFLKYPFIEIDILPSTYGIHIRKHEIAFKWIKEGDIYGGW